MEHSKKNKILELFFTSEHAGFSYKTFEQTPLTKGIAVALLLIGNAGIAWCILSTLSKSMDIDVSSIAFLGPWLSHAWLNIVLVATGAILLCAHIRIRYGESGRADIVEKAKWRKDKEAKAKDERRLYDEYRKVYKVLSTFMSISIDAMSPGAWERMNMQLLGAYDMLSMHMSPAVRSLPMSKVIEHWLGTEQFEEQVLSQVSELAAELEDIVQIWSSPYGFNGVKVVWRGQGDDDSLDRIAKTMGIDDMLDAYYSGVPLEDVLA